MLSPEASLLAFGGAVSLLLGALSGFWLNGWMRRNPAAGPDRYRMVLHKEALWSCFLCFALAGWIDRLPVPAPVRIVLALAVVGTGWFAIAQYFFVARAGLRNTYTEASPVAARVFGACAMLANIIAVVGLLVATTLALFAS